MATVTRPGIAQEKAKKTAFRPDIQGLRMVAVVAVILDHLFGWPAGGFVGVDVFFVISGFLITSLLLREHEQTGTISFTSFYRRRLKRIAPAATLVIVVVVAASFYLLAKSRSISTLWDGMWAFLFVANWNFAAQGTDYFAADSPPSPLRHFWSLSVEEQFYFVWPWIMLLVLTLVAGRLGATKRTALLWTGALLAIVTLASFGWSLWETSASPTWAYFSTLSRTWELGVGALLAIASAYLARLPQWSRTPLAYAGLTGIVVSLFLISSTTPFPSPAAVLPVLATAAVIAAGTGSQPRFLWPLTNPVSRWFGDVSYSLYLWHWPVIVLLAAVVPARDMLFFLTAIILTLGVSAFSYHFIEDPIRRSSWLEPQSPKSRRRRSHRQGGVSFSQRTQAGVLIIVTAVTSGLVIAALMPKAQSTATPRVAPAVGGIATTDPNASAEPTDPLATELAAAVQATSYPALTPDIGTAADIRPLEDSDGCGDVSHTNTNSCVFGSGERLAVVVGDSVANTWIATVRAALEQDGWTVRGLGKAGCPMVDVEILREGNPHTECFEHRQWVQDRVAELQPELVLISGTEGQANSLASAAKGTAAASEWGDGAERTYAALAGSADRLVVVSPMPLGKSAEECYRPVGGTPDDCLSRIGDLWKQISAAELSAAEAAGATYVDTHEWFCTSDGSCPVFAGTTLVRADTVHMTPAYSQRLAPYLKPYLLGEAVAD